MNGFVHENSPAFDLPSLDLTRFPELLTPQTVGEKYLIFFLGGELFAVSSKKVSEATSLLNVSTLPFAPEWLLGIANVRGEIIPVVNLPILLQKYPSPSPPKSKSVILRSQILEFGVALTVDRISEIIALPDKNIHLVNDEKAPYIYGKSVYKTQTLNFINTEKLLASLRSKEKFPLSPA